jgi:hypothetical protein
VKKIPRFFGSNRSFRHIYKGEGKGTTVEVVCPSCKKIWEVVPGQIVHDKKTKSSFRAWPTDRGRCTCAACRFQPLDPDLPFNPDAQSEATNTKIREMATDPSNL